MDNSFLTAITDQMGEFLNEHNFNNSDGIYLNDSKAFKISYNDEKKLFELFTADVTDGTMGEFTQKSSWLFDETQTIRDIDAVVIDFTDTLKQELGIKKMPRRSSTDIELPGKSSAGAADTVTSLCSKLLAVYPQHKDTYKAHVLEYGELLAIRFFSETFTVEIRKTLTDNNKKQVKKVFDVLSETYVNGDKIVCNVIPEVLILGAVGNNSELLERALGYLSDCPYLATAVKNLAARLSRDKKLRSVILK